MRRITSIEDPVRAQRLLDWFRVGGVRACARQQEEGSQGIWIEDEDLLETASRLLAEFLQDPDHPRFAQSALEARKLREQQEAEIEKRRQNYVDVRTRWHTDQMALPVMTYALIGLCLVVAWATDMGAARYPYGVRLMFDPVVFEGGRPVFLSWGALSTGEIWRFLTPMFIHFGIFHLVFNMFWLKDLGTRIERDRGWAFFLGLVLITSLAANLAQYSWTGSPRFGGMSGVVYGLFGYLWSHGKHHPRSKIGVDEGTVRVLMLWLMLCMTGLVGPIANGAHLGGLVMGRLIGMKF